MPRQRDIVIGGIAAGLVAGGVWLLLRKNTEEADADAFTQSSAPARAPATSEVVREAAAGPAPVGERPRAAPVAAEEGMGEAQESTLGDLDRDASRYSFVALPEEESAKAGSGNRQIVRDGVALFPRLGVALPLPTGWIAHEDMAPVPNVSVIAITKPEFQHAQQSGPAGFGTTPAVLLSVEDVSAEGVNAAEYKEKSKNLAYTQMMMMTRGMFQPQIIFDGELTVGRFSLSLEYIQRTPDFQMQVMNLIHVESGLAYVLQIMANPQVFEQYKSSIMSIARGIELSPPQEPKTLAEQAYLSVTSKGHTISVPASWKIQSVSGSNASEAIFQFSTGSASKTESINIYKNDSDAVVSVLASGTVQDEKTLQQGVTRTTIVDHSSRREKLLFTNGSFAALVQPLKTKTCVVRDGICGEMLASIAVAAASSTAGSSGVVQQYVSTKKKIRFTALPGSTILESRVGDGSILYAPDGINQEQDSATMTIRVEDPTTDPDCMGSLDEWFARIKSESSDGTISDIRRETVSRLPAVTFTTKEMAEVGPGMRDERTAKVVIFVTDGRTTMLRWESSTGDFRKHERKLTQVLESLVIG